MALSLFGWLVLSQVLGAVTPGAMPASADNVPSTFPSTESSELLVLVEEVLARAPKLEHANRHIAVLEARVRGSRVWPDPVASATLFALPPETRVGPQRFKAQITQTIPLPGKLALQERTAELAIEPARAQVRVVEADLVTETRRLFYELAFLERHRELLTSERRVLERYEGASQARYGSGNGTQQEIVRIQAQITRLDTQLLTLRERRAALLAALNALRDRAPDTPVVGLALPSKAKLSWAPSSLEERIAEALGRRPEFDVLQAQLELLSKTLELETRRRRADLTVGLAYTLVEPREDRQGRLMEPEGNGDDILAVTGSIPLQFRKARFEAREDGVRARMRVVESEQRVLESQIRATLGDLHARLPLLAEHWTLLESVLRPQAAESLRSAETAYGTGQINAVDLLDAEVVLFEVNIQIARTQADLALALVQLDRASGLWVGEGTR